MLILNRRWSEPDSVSKFVSLVDGDLVAMRNRGGRMTWPGPTDDANVSDDSVFGLDWRDRRRGGARGDCETVIVA